VADEVCKTLEANGLRCWIAPRDILPGQEWSAAIIDAISKTDVMVLIFSSDANKSPQIRREVERAVAKDVRVLPFRIENVVPGKSLEYFVSTSHWLDAYADPLEKNVEKLIETIRRLIETRESRGSVPPSPMRSERRFRSPAASSAWWRPAAGLAAAAAIGAAYLLLKKEPPQITGVQFPPVVVAGGRDTVGTVQFEAGSDDVAEAQFQVVAADAFEPFSIRPDVADEKQGSLPFRIRSKVPQQVTLRATLVDKHGRRSRPVSFSFEVRKAPSTSTSTGRERTLEIPLPQGLKLKIPH
jgi:hypothetical protein